MPSVCARQKPGLVLITVQGRFWEPFPVSLPAERGEREEPRISDPRYASSEKRRAKNSYVLLITVQGRDGSPRLRRAQSRGAVRGHLGEATHKSEYNEGEPLVPSPRRVGRGLILLYPFSYLRRVDFNPCARALRPHQTDEEKQLWRALRAGRFAGFKFRRQHSLGSYILDFYCPMARLSIEMDGFHHGLPEPMKEDQARREFLHSHAIEELRFWNHQWRKNPEAVLLEIWQVVHRRTGCVQVKRKTENQRFVPPQPGQLKDRSPCRELGPLSPSLSPPSGEKGKDAQRR